MKSVLDQKALSEIKHNFETQMHIPEVQIAGLQGMCMLDVFEQWNIREKVIINNMTPLHILIIGSGRGEDIFAISQYALEHKINITNITAVDIDQKAIKNLKAIFRNSQGIELINQDIIQFFRYNKIKFHLIIWSHPKIFNDSLKVSQYIPDTIKIIKNHLAKDSLLYIGCYFIEEINCMGKLLQNFGLFATQECKPLTVKSGVMIDFRRKEFSEVLTNEPHTYSFLIQEGIHYHLQLTKSKKISLEQKIQSIPLISMPEKKFIDAQKQTGKSNISLACKLGLFALSTTIGVTAAVTYFISNNHLNKP